MAYLFIQPAKKRQVKLIFATIKKQFNLTPLLQKLIDASFGSSKHSPNNFAYYELVIKLVINVQ